MTERWIQVLLVSGLMSAAACADPEPPEDAVELEAADERAARLWESIDGYEDWPVVPTDEPILVHALDSDDGSTEDWSLYVVEPLDLEPARLSIIERRGDEGAVRWAEFSPAGRFVYAFEDTEDAEDTEDIVFRIRRRSDYACVGCHQGS